MSIRRPYWMFCNDLAFFRVTVLRYVPVRNINLILNSNHSRRYLSLHCVDNSWVTGYHADHWYEVHNENIECGHGHFHCVAAVDAPRNTSIVDDVCRKIGEGDKEHRCGNPDEHYRNDHDMFLHLQLQTDRCCSLYSALLFQLIISFCIAVKCIWLANKQTKSYTECVK